MQNLDLNPYFLLTSLVNIFSWYVKGGLEWSQRIIYEFVLASIEGQIHSNSVTGIVLVHVNRISNLIIEEMPAL